VEEFYVTDGEDKVPLHVKNDRLSVFERISAEDFHKMRTLDIQEKLRERHIVLTNVTHDPVDFEEIGFFSLETTMEAIISIQGFFGLRSYVYLYSLLLQINL
jgi:hypothetical protein